jgi:dTDP-4-dehydrorhamnose reductase
MPPLSVVVLGASGMLGSTIVRRLRARQASWRVDGAARGAPGVLRLEAEAGRSGLRQILLPAQYDFIINCVGVLKSAIDLRRTEAVERAVRVNALFPHELADVAGEAQSRVIHVSSDAVFSGRHTGPYSEQTSPDPDDAYGMTKALGESSAPNVLNVRCSIVGRDSRGRGLVDWYLAVAADRSVSGYSDYVWTPVTTVQFADFCEGLMQSGFSSVRACAHVIHFAPNASLSKAEFLMQLRSVASRGAAIEPRSGPEGPCRRILTSAWRPESPLALSNRGWPDLIAEMLAEFHSGTHD